MQPEDFDPPPQPLPCAGGLIAGTLALMTTFADRGPDARTDAATERTLIARKIVSNLFFLQQHPDLGAPLRQVIANVRLRWLPLARAQTPARPALAAALH